MRLKRLYIIALIIGYTSMQNYLFGQHDTICFYKGEKKQKIIKIPLNKFEVKIKPIKGKKIKALIVNYRDSIIELKERNNSKEVSTICKLTIQREWDIYKNKKLSVAQLDSMGRRNDSIINALTYSIEKNVKQSKIN